MKGHDSISYVLDTKIAQRFKHALLQKELHARALKGRAMSTLFIDESTNQSNKMRRKRGFMKA
jgi:hypothetical protein